MPQPDRRPPVPPPPPPAPRLQELACTFTLTVREETGLLRPWVGTMTHGPMHVGEAGGGGVWRARTRARLIRKMAGDAGRMGAEFGHQRIVIVVEDG